MKIWPKLMIKWKLKKGNLLFPNKFDESIDEKNFKFAKCFEEHSKTRTVRSTILNELWWTRMIRSNSWTLKMLIILSVCEIVYMYLPPKKWNARCAVSTDFVCVSCDQILGTMSDVLVSAMLVCMCSI